MRKTRGNDMENLSPETKQKLKRYSYELINLDTNEIVDSKRSRKAAEKRQNELFTNGIICKLITKNNK